MNGDTRNVRRSTNAPGILPVPRAGRLGALAAAVLAILMVTSAGAAAQSFADTQLSLGDGDRSLESDVDCCQTNLSLSTGIGDDGLLSPGDRDQDWRLMSTPNKAGPLDQAAYVISPHSTWSSPSGERWIGPTANSGSLAPSGWYTFQFEFYLASPSATISLRFMTDDTVEFHLNGQGPLKTGSGPGTWKGWTYSGSAFQKGANVLEVRLWNYCCPTGFVIDGSILADCVSSDPIETEASGFAAEADLNPGAVHAHSAHTYSGQGTGSAHTQVAQATVGAISSTLTAVDVQATTDADLPDLRGHDATVIEQASLLGGLVKAESLRAEVDARVSSGVGTVDTGASQFGYLEVAGNPIPVNVAPDTKIPLPGLGYLVLKETNLAADTTTVEGVVNMIHVYLTKGSVTGEIIVGQAYAGVGCDGLGSVLETDDPDDGDDGVTDPTDLTVVRDPREILFEPIPGPIDHPGLTNETAHSLDVAEPRAGNATL